MDIGKAMAIFHILVQGGLQANNTEEKEGRKSVE